MKLLIIMMMLFSSSVFARGVNFQQDIYPIFVNNCASCHNANTPAINWLDETTATNNKSSIYNRVFQKGDMPFMFKYFGGEDKALLREWLIQPDVDGVN